MSKLCDYSKFDNLDSDSESSGNNNDNDCRGNNPPDEIDSTASLEPGKMPQQQQQKQSQEARMNVTKKGSEEGRYIFECNGRKVYEWEQSLEEVNIYIDAPPNTSASALVCNILPSRLQLGLRGSDRFFIDEATYGKVNLSDSSWYLDADDGIINIVLAKVYRGETWENALLGVGERQGQVVDPFTKQQIQKDLMIERFQEENPGFDFRGAEFNGAVPDPRTFMGGVRYS